MYLQGQLFCLKLCLDRRRGGVANASELLDENTSKMVLYNGCTLEVRTNGVSMPYRAL